MEKYRDIGLKLTPQRLAILDCLDGNTNHPSAEDIYRVVRRKFPTMSFSTVYNTLEALRQRGEVLELTVDPERKRYDPDTSEHHHLICVRCRKIVDVRADYSIRIPAEVSEGFEVIGNNIEFHGICARCTKQKD
jgi:Fur family peroxide stress response transcriptional regulator